MGFYETGGWGTPATDRTAAANTKRIRREMLRNEDRVPSLGDANRMTCDLRDELGRAGIKGFRRGGRVHRTGIYRLHRGERVIPARGRRGRRR